LLVTFDNAVTAFEFAVFVTSITINIVSVVALFKESIVNNTIPTSRKGAGRSASVWQTCIHRTLVAKFVGIDNTIAASWESAVGSASVGDGIGVQRSIIALLSCNGSVREQSSIFFHTISTSAVGLRGKSVKNLLQESIFRCASGEQDRQDRRSLDSGVLGGVEELNFEGELLISNPVLTGFVELDVTQDIGSSFPVEGSSSDDWE